MFRVALAAIVVGTLAALVWWGLEALSPPSPAGGPGPAASATPDASAPGGSAELPGAGGEEPEASGDDEVYRGELGPLPASLVGTEVDGDLRADARGRFVAGPEAIRLFDYFLAAQGEEPLSMLRARIEREIDTRLPESARPGARDLLDTYLDYLRAVADLEPTGPAAEDMERRLQRLRELRRGHFGAELAATLFADDEKLAMVSVERRRILDDPTLGPRDRIERLAELQAQLPEDVLAAEEEAMLPMRLDMEEDRLRAQGASDAEIRALRERMLGPEAADRMDDLDRRRRIWEHRMEAYRRERDAVFEEIPSADEATRNRFLRNVRERHFEPDEIPRVEAVERIEAQQQGQLVVPRMRTQGERDAAGSATAADEDEAPPAL